MTDTAALSLALSRNINPQVSQTRAINLCSTLLNHVGNMQVLIESYKVDGNTTAPTLIMIHCNMLVIVATQQ